MRKIIKTLIRGNQRWMGIKKVLERSQGNSAVVKITECPSICSGACKPCAKHWMNSPVKMLSDHSLVLHSNNHPDIFVLIPPPYTNGGYQIEIAPRKR